MPQVNIKLVLHSYPVLIGHEMGAQLRKVLKKHIENKRVFLFFDSGFYALHGESVEKSVTRECPQILTMVIPSGEKSKSDLTLTKVYDFLIQEKVSRNDFLLVCGGGVTTDLIGYAAATVLRGIRWGALSTTLLGMVDAAIGGKTGINHKLGKNLIGAFWQPSFVLCDAQYLQTLPEREMVAGLGEILKYGGLIGSGMLSELENYYAKGDLYNSARLRRLITKCVKYKSMIVMKDERESNLRMHLNLGHTFGHAIEKTIGYGRIRHGEAVILGLLFALFLSRKAFPGNRKALEPYECLVKRFVGLVRYYPVESDDIILNMKVDKKRTGDSQKFVLLNRPGRPFIASDLNDKLVRESIEESLSIYRDYGGADV